MIPEAKQGAKRILIALGNRARVTRLAKLISKLLEIKEVQP